MRNTSPSGRISAALRALSGKSGPSNSAPRISVGVSMWGQSLTTVSIERRLPPSRASVAARTSPMPARRTSRLITMTAFPVTAWLPILAPRLGPEGLPRGGSAAAKPAEGPAKRSGRPEPTTASPVGLENGPSSGNVARLLAVALLASAALTVAVVFRRYRRHLSGSSRGCPHDGAAPGYDGHPDVPHRRPRRPRRAVRSPTRPPVPAPRPTPTCTWSAPNSDRGGRWR